MNNTNQKWIIDTDPGCDDMMAILYMVTRPSTDILMISLVDGNVSLDNVSINSRKILKISGKTIPLYRGSSNPIIKNIPNIDSYHYCDGLGDIEEIQKFNADDIRIEKENSIIKIIEYAEKYPGEINLLLLGPLTTIAAAYMIHPHIKDLFKSIYMMGGSIFSRGNTLPSSEFNFCYDYIAAKIVINNFRNIIITPWEPTEIIYLRDIHMDEIRSKLDIGYDNINKLQLHFVHLILKKYTIEKGGLTLCDLYSAIPAFARKSVLKYSICRIDIVIDSPNTNGMCCFNSRKVVNREFDESIDEILASMKEIGNHVVIELLDENVIMKEYESIFM
jgi:purine nucleosidase